MINIYICITALIIGIYMAWKEYINQFSKYAYIYHIISFVCMFVTGFFISESYKYLIGKPTIFF